MRHNLGELRAAALQWLDDPHGDTFAANGSYGRLDQLINEAYASAVDELDAIPQPWSLSLESEAVEVTTVAGTREYSLGRARNVIEVVEELTGGTHGTPITIIPQWKRNTAGDGVYLFRDDASGDWYLGLALYVTPQYATLHVFVRQVVAKLASTGDVPLQIPEQWHELIVYKAAMLGLMQQARDAKAQTALYAEKLQQMRSAKPPGNPMRARKMVD